MNKLLYTMLLAIALVFVNCSNKQVVKQPQTILLRVESEIDVKVTVDYIKDCTGNWNFCRYQ